MAVQYLEDLTPGQRFQTGVHQLDADQIKAFASEFDPQPFHMDETAAQDSIFRGLSASGWHTAALTMKLLATGEFRPAGGFIGAGIEEFQWPRPVRPDDALSVELEILDVRVSKSKPQQGIVKARCTTLNQNNEPVQRYVINMVVQRRPSDIGYPEASS